MGNSCKSMTCCSGKSDLDFHKKTTDEMDSNLKELMKRAKKNEDKVIKIQAHYKGHRARKEFAVEPKP